MGEGGGKREELGLFRLRLGLLCLTVGLVAYGELAWIFSLTAEIRLRWENRFGLVYLGFPP